MTNMYAKNGGGARRLWLTACGLCAAVSLASAVATRGQSLANSLYGCGDGFLMDFFSHIAYVDDPAGVYFSGVHASFPPLAYCLYALLRAVCPVITPENEALYHSMLRANYPSLLIYVVYACLLALMTLACVRLYIKGERASFLTAAALLISNVFVAGLLERGNSAYISLLLMMAAYRLMDSDRRPRRELALICVALATGLKMYPAVFALLYLRERRFWEITRLMLYSLVCFLLPFAFFGGVDGFLRFISNQSAIQTAYGNLWSLPYLVKTLLGRLSFVAAPAPEHAAALSSAAFLAICLLAALKAPCRWKSCALLLLPVMLLPKSNGYYIFCYMAIPMLDFFSGGEFGAKGFIYAFLFAVIFMPMAALAHDASERVAAAASYAMAATLVFDVFIYLNIMKRGITHAAD